MIIFKVNAEESTQNKVTFCVVGLGDFIVLSELWKLKMHIKLTSFLFNFHMQFSYIAVYIFHFLDMEMARCRKTWCVTVWCVFLSWLELCDVFLSWLQICDMIWPRLALCDNDQMFWTELQYKIWFYNIYGPEQNICQFNETRISVNSIETRISIFVSYRVYMTPM